MIAAARLIEALRSYLNAELVVPSLTVGVAEPSAPSGLPAVVLSLVQLVNPSKGMGGHRQVKHGALPGSTQLDLSDPVLPDDPSVELLSEGRLSLNLFHGGLVDAEGSDTPLQASDIQVARDGVPFTLVGGSPTAGEFIVDAELGLLTFGAALPVDGSLRADYFIGQWEVVVHQLQGILRIASMAGNNADAEMVSNQVYDALAVQAIPGLRDLDVVSLGPVETHSESPPMRVRTLEWRFDYEAVVDLPDASGGIIERVGLLSTLERDGEGGVVEEEQITLEQQ